MYAEATPNPHAMKFVCDIRLLETDAFLEVNSAEEALKISPLANEIFKFPFVRAVHIAPNFLTVLKNDDIAWEEIVVSLREMIRDFIMSGIPAVSSKTNEDNTQKKQLFTQPETTDETSKRIEEILEQYVKPAVEKDGGSIRFRSFRNGVVKVAMGGACSGCPSTTVTLKNGVETLLKQMLPDQVFEVDTEDI